MLLLARAPQRRLPLPDHETALPRGPQGRKVLILALSAAIFFFHAYTAVTGLWSATLQRAMHWCLVGTLLFILSAPPENSAGKTLGRVWDAFCILALATATLYLFLHWESMTYRVVPPGRMEILFGSALLLATLEAARRNSGLFLSLTALAFILYAMLGPYMPGILRHKGYSLGRIISYLYGTSGGIYGIPLGVSATYIILFVFFGAFLNASGAGRLLMECSLALTGRFTGGAAKTAVDASALMGTMSG
ncbi:MAG: TRAP transporter large permease subunit, partial [Deltaproteobacteria bacterium]|nr:TRAP transporter large permease subunit [Deltaproteobacteria bacterium]